MKRRRLKSTERIELFLQKMNATYDPTFVPRDHSKKRPLPPKDPVATRANMTCPVVVSFDPPNAQPESFPCEVSKVFPFRISGRGNAQEEYKLIQDLQENDLWKKVPEEIREERLKNLWECLADEVINELRPEPEVKPKTRKAPAKKKAAAKKTPKNSRKVTIVDGETCSPP